MLPSTFPVVQNSSSTTYQISPFLDHSSSHATPNNPKNLDDGTPWMQHAHVIEGRLLSAATRTSDWKALGDWIREGGHLTYQERYTKSTESRRIMGEMREELNIPTCHGQGEKDLRDLPRGDKWTEGE